MLRVWRQRLTPQMAGLPANTGRRTKGLRREELAVLASVSADYIVRLEQGRSSAPSVQVCVVLAQALQLGDTEQEHLFRLRRARNRRWTDHPDGAREHPTPGRAHRRTAGGRFRRDVEPTAVSDCGTRSTHHIVRSPQASDSAA
ncbi:helix-turn-helix domain-containing protein [Rhodococcus sp. CH91]|uniref:helix-turn-helix domain-containing protein n=1 Tax=Rhodococcus sp. CH91 TaxID=2910256 RepID=UPI0035A83C7D